MDPLLQGWRASGSSGSSGRRPGGTRLLLRVVKLGGFVNADPGFTDVPKVINGASDLMVDVFGEAGRHARSAVGCSVLPLNAAVEVDAVIEVQ